MRTDWFHLHKPDASTIIQQMLGQIIEYWETQARQALPAIHHASREEIRNALPEFIQCVSRFISTTSQTTGGERFSDEAMNVARIHGAHRARSPNYTLDQVIKEYRLLRQSVFYFIEKQIPLTREEREKLLESFDIGMVEAATEFAASRGLQSARLHEAETEVKDLKSERLLRERFVSTLTHDLRTPLTAVKISADLIARRADQEDLVRKLAVKISESSDRMDHMIRDLLDANRLEAGEIIPLRIQACELKKLTQETLDTLATIHGDRFTLVAEGDLNGFWSPFDIQRVLENLISNAIKYGSNDSMVTIELTRLDGIISLSVHNEGNPISPEQQRYLFEPYKRLVSAQTGGEVGWGIGLTLVKGIVKAHGGQIQLKSGPDIGTTFTVYLPIDSRAFQPRN